MIQEAIVSLLWPFEWHLTLIPILPDIMMAYVEAPVPFIIGLKNDTKRPLKNISSMNDVTLLLPKPYQFSVLKYT